MVSTFIHVISLESAIGRRKRFVDRAQTVALSWEFFAAHTILHPALFHDSSQVQHHHRRTLTHGELGCYSSHAALWEALLTDSPYDQYIILEDDVVADWAALDMIAAHDFAAAGHNYVRLYGRKPSPYRMISSNYLPGPKALIQFTGKPFGTQGYVITRAGAARMLEACRLVRRPLDDQMDRFWETGIPNLALYPFPIIEEFVPSTIEESRYTDGRSRRSRYARWKDKAARRLAMTGLLKGGVVRTAPKD